MTYVAPASFTCFFKASCTVEADPTKQSPSSAACSNDVGRSGGAGKPRLRERCVRVHYQAVPSIALRGIFR
jgi:hypothetical protein